MCGIVGAMSVDNLPYNKEKWFKDALYVDALRGMHSTGVLSLNTLYTPRVVKRAMTPADFLDLKKAENLFKGQHRVLLGHNRHATKGAINNNNAHPFTHGHITLVHNGSLNVFRTLKGSEQFDVDSEAIAYSISVEGVAETVKLLNGAYSLVWWDANTKTMNFIRNDERPMHIAFFGEEKGAVFASEPWMITELADRKATTFDHLEPQETEVGVLYTYEVGANKEKKKIVLESKRLEMYKPVYYPPARQPNRRNEADYPLRRARRNAARNSGGNHVDHKLDQFGLKRGDMVKFGYIEMEPTPNGKCKITGAMNTSPWLPVKIYNAPRENYDFNADLKAKLVSIATDAASDYWPDVILDFKTIKLDDGEDDNPFWTKEELEQMGDGIPGHNSDDINGEAEEVVEEKKYEIYNGELVNAQGFIDACGEGCANCSAPIFVDDHKEVEWRDRDTVLCKECKKTKGVLSLVH